jgi:hypothetical protein
MHTFGLIFLAALLLTVVLRLWLATRHAAHVAAHRNAVPAQFSTVITLDAHQRAADYTCAKTRFAMIDLLAGTAVTLVFTFGGGLQALHEGAQLRRGAVLDTDVGGRRIPTADAAEDAALTEALAAVGDEGDADDEDDEGAKPKPKPKARRAAKAHRAAINAKRKRPDRDDFFALMFLARCKQEMGDDVDTILAAADSAWKLNGFAGDELCSHP